MIIINKLFKQISKNLGMKTNKFIVKLLEMMKEFPQIINWSPSGAEIQISDIQRFSVDVHPKYFTSSNYQSFLRQLNMYGFKKMAKRKNTVSFSHPQFQQGNETRFDNIKRRQQKTHQRPTDPLHLHAQLEMEDSPTGLTSPPPLLDLQIRETLILIKKQVTQKGVLLVQKLQRMLQKTARRVVVSSQSKLFQSSSTQQLRQYVSFCRLQEVLMQRGELQGGEFNFQSGNFNHSLYFQQ